MMYPMFYEIIPSDVIQTVMEQALNSDEMELKLYDSHIEEVKSMQKLNCVKYFRIKYSTTMSMKMSDTTNQNDVELDRNAFILIALNKEFGEENVSYLEGLNKFEVITTKNSLAILDPLYTGWKIINVEKAYQPILVKILPQEILDQFSIYCIAFNDYCLALLPKKSPEFHVGLVASSSTILPIK